MKRQNKLLPIITAAVVVALVLLTCRFTFVPDQKTGAASGESSADGALQQYSLTEQYVIDHWDDKMLPTIRERAVDAGELMRSVAEDLNAAGLAYGSRANETSAWSFCVKAEARVLDVENADKPNRTNLLLDLKPFNGEVDCKLHYGKVFPSNIKNAIRDGVGFLKLDDFANQVEFADLTTAFNNKVKEDIILAQAADAYKGRTVALYGCISLQNVNPESLVIVPVELRVTED